MKLVKFGILGLILSVLASCVSLSAPASSIKVMTFNIRCGYCEQPTDINHWSNRKAMVADIIEKSGADIIGFQEAEQFQIDDLMGLLNGFEAYGIGREEGDRGERNTIFVRKSRFEVLEKSTIWLSPTPNQSSLGWDARYRRTLTISRLRDKQTNKIINFYNAHFDHEGRAARYQSALAVLAEAAKHQGEPIILTGDFNDRPGFDGHAALSGKLRDTAITSQTPHQGGDMSFNGFGRDLRPANKIDYIFVSDNFTVKSSEIITRLYDGHYPSDHFPILSEVSYR